MRICKNLNNSSKFYARYIKLKHIIYWYKIVQQINYKRAKICRKKSKTLKYYNMHIYMNKLLMFS